MANYKPAFKEILEKIKGFYKSEVDEECLVNLNDAYNLLDKIEKICHGVLGDNNEQRD